MNFTGTRINPVHCPTLYNAVYSYRTGIVSETWRTVHVITCSTTIQAVFLNKYDRYSLELCIRNCHNPQIRPNVPIVPNGPSKIDENILISI